MNVLAVVAARGGQQRVHRKNIAPLLGRPMLAYTLDHAKDAQSIHRTVVSTEAEDIAAVARELGAEVLERPAEMATPESRLDHMLRHAIRTIEDRDQWRADVVVMLYGSVPIRPPGFIDQCVEKLIQSGADSVRSVTPAGEWHPLWSVKLKPNGAIDEYLGKLNVYRRQDLPPVYYYTGACVVIRTDALMGVVDDGDDHFSYLGEDRRAVVHEPGECVEIHEPMDIEWAEFLLCRRRP